MFLFTEKNINYIFYIIERYIYKIKIRKKDNNDKNDKLLYLLD